MRFSEFWSHLKINKWGKYVFTLVLFGIVYVFIGDQSMLEFLRRGREIRKLEEQRDLYRAGAEEAQREIETLQQPDSLERYAREHYYMHSPNEDIYLIDETN
jgi:cell division protein FtsB